MPFHSVSRVVCSSDFGVKSQSGGIFRTKFEEFICRSDSRI